MIRRFIGTIALVLIAFSFAIHARNPNHQPKAASNDYCFGNFCIDRKEFGFVLNLQHKLDQCERDLQEEVKRKSKKQIEQVRETTPFHQNKLNEFIERNPQFKFMKEFDNFRY